MFDKKEVLRLRHELERAKSHITCLQDELSTVKSKYFKASSVRIKTLNDHKPSIGKPLTFICFSSCSKFKR